MSLCCHTIRTISHSRAPAPRSLLPFLYQTPTIQQWRPAAPRVARRTLASRPDSREDVPYEEWFKDEKTQSATKPATQRKTQRDRAPRSDVQKDAPYEEWFKGDEEAQPARKPTAQRTAHQNRTQRSYFGEHIPFEDAESLPTSVDEGQSTRRTTMTRTERAAFEKLCKAFNAQGQGKSQEQRGQHEELDQIADEYWEDDDDDTSSNTVEKVFGTALQPSSKSPDASGVTTGAVDPQESNDPAKAQLRAARQAARIENQRINKYRQEELERVNRQFEVAETDYKLWTILESEVFDQLRSVDLNNPHSMKPPPIGARKAKRNHSTSAQPDQIDKRYLFRNYPQNIIKAFQVLRENFPASILPFNIIPTIKTIGIVPYALCVTTDLYQQLIRTAWIQQSSYPLIDELLSDMDANVIPFNSSILTLLDSIIREHEQARGGVFGKEVQMVHNMDMWIEGISKIKGWRRTVADRLSAQAQAG